MNIVCPKCKTVYKLNYQKLLPNGKTVKCIKCHNVWFEKYNHIPAKDDVFRYPLPVVIKQDSKQTFPLKLLAIATTTLSLIIAFIFFQDFMSEKIPAASRVYDKMGIPLTNSIVLDNFEISRKEPNTIDINGFIINKSYQKRRIPPLKITLIDKNGKTIKKIITRTPSLYFDSNQKHPFFYKILNAPENTHVVSVKIADKFDILGIAT